MQVYFNTQAKGANKYKAISQKIRFLSEHWVGNEVFCPNCGKKDLHKFENSRPVADFYCKNCSEEYELKSKKNTIGNQVLDGAYKTMIERLHSNNNPNFFFLSYNPEEHSVKNFMVMPKHFFTSNIIKKRNPLSPTARRAGWIGCNILLNNIPSSGRIFYIKNGQIETKNKVLEHWQRTLFLRGAKKAGLRGWLLDIMNCIDALDKKEFTLQDIYHSENELSKKHPSNTNIKPKVRQQLQFLRDKGYVSFLGNGQYKIR